jgi:hypothetical protein
LTLPAATDTLVGKATTDTLTNKTLTGAAMNGTLGATTPSTVAATTISASSTATFAAGAAGTPSITTTGDTNTGILFPAADTVAVATGGTEVARFDSAGNLGLGVTPSAWNVGKAIEVGSVGNSVWGPSSSQISILQNAYYNGAFKYASTAAASYYQQVSGIHAWYNAPSGTAGNTISFTQAMTLDASGNLIVGGTSPTTSSGYTSLSINNATNSGYLVLQSNGTNKSDWFVSSGTVATLRGVSVPLSLESTGANHIKFETNATERARIDSSGNLLVGTTTASGRLSIDSAGTTSATYIIFGRNSAASNKFTVRSDGAGFLDSAAWTYGSDATIKENIEYLEPSNCLSLLLNAKPAKFDYIEGQKANYGYIAQDVQKWLPEAVSETPNGKLGLQDGFINAIGTGAIQALHQLIEEQQALITTLTARITALESA